jgi:HK97 gp10 family phage protein
MIRVSARFRGVDALKRRMEQRGRAATARMQVALEEAATIVQSEAQRLVADPPKSGRVYVKSRPRRIHRASAPGQAPATDLGNLIASIIVDRADLPRGRIRIAATAAYAKHLEFGTRKMAPRPFLRRALREMRPRIVAVFAKAVAR